MPRHERQKEKRTMHWPKKKQLNHLLAPRLCVVLHKEMLPNPSKSRLQIYEWSGGKHIETDTGKIVPNTNTQIHSEYTQHTQQNQSSDMSTNRR